MSNYVLGESSARKLKAMFSDTKMSSRRIPNGSNCEFLYSDPYEVRWSQMQNDGDGSWAIWLPNSNGLLSVDGVNLSAIEDDMDPCEYYPEGWYKLNGFDDESTAVYLVITNEEGVSSVSYVDEVTSQTEGTVIKIADLYTDEDTLARSVKQFVTSAIRVTGGEVEPAPYPFKIEEKTFNDQQVLAIFIPDGSFSDTNATVMSAWSSFIGSLPAIGGGWYNTGLSANATIKLVLYSNGQGISFVLTNATQNGAIYIWNIWKNGHQIQVGGIQTDYSFYDDKSIGRNNATAAPANRVEIKGWKDQDPAESSLAFNLGLTNQAAASGSSEVVVRGGKDGVLSYMALGAITLGVKTVSSTTTTTSVTLTFTYFDNTTSTVTIPISSSPTPPTPTVNDGKLSVQFGDSGAEQIHSANTASDYTLALSTVALTGEWDDIKNKPDTPFDFVGELKYDSQSNQLKQRVDSFSIAGGVTTGQWSTLIQFNKVDAVVRSDYNTSTRAFTNYKKELNVISAGEETAVSPAIFTATPYPPSSSSSS